MATVVAGKVMIVEDERDLAFLMRSVLEEEGYQVAICVSGNCFDAIRRFQPDVVLCDYMLPEYDGRQVLGRLREEVAPDTPVIMVSAISSATREWRQWGADDFIEKPFDISRLISAVARAISPDATRWTRRVDESSAGEQAS